MSSLPSCAESHALEIIRFFYPEDTPFRQLLIRHSYQVCGKALEILPRCTLTPAPDPELVTEGALLHDIGIGRCHAPDILCTGTEPYIAHGIIGARMLREYGAGHGLDLEPYARICERHTGTGESGYHSSASAAPRTGFPAGNACGKIDLSGGQVLFQIRRHAGKNAGADRTVPAQIRSRNAGALGGTLPRIRRGISSCRGRGKNNLSAGMPIRQTARKRFRLFFYFF